MSMQLLSNVLQNGKAIKAICESIPVAYIKDGVRLLRLKEQNAFNKNGPRH